MAVFCAILNEMREKTGAENLPLFPLVRAGNRLYGTRVNTVVVAVYQRHPCLSNSLKHPSADRDCASQRAACAVDLTFTQLRFREGIPFLDVLPRNASSNLAVGMCNRGLAEETGYRDQPVRFCQ